SAVLSLLGSRAVRRPFGGRPPDNQGTPGDEDQEQSISHPPQPGLHRQRQQRLDEKRVGQQGQQAARIARGVEGIGVLRRGAVAFGKPLLQQRSTGGEHKKGKPDRPEEKAEQRYDGIGSAGGSPVGGKSDRQREYGQGEHDQMQQALAAA